MNSTHTITRKENDFWSTYQDGNPRAAHLWLYLAPDRYIAACDWMSGSRRPYTRAYIDRSWPIVITERPRNGHAMCMDYDRNGPRPDIRAIETDRPHDETTW